MPLLNLTVSGIFFFFFFLEPKRVPSDRDLCCSPASSVHWLSLLLGFCSRQWRLKLVVTVARALKSTQVRGLEAHGVPSKQAEAITSAITEVLNDSLENVAHSFVSKAEMQKEHHFFLLQRETEKLLSDIDKMRRELRYEIDKVTAGQRLDLNLERGRIRDKLANQNAETTNLTNKLEREIHALRAQLEAAKYDLIKYCMGTLVSKSAVGLSVIRIILEC